MLRTQIRVQSWWLSARRRLWERLRDERGDAYSGILFIAIGVVIALTVGRILLDKFVDLANSIATDTPTEPASGGASGG